VSGLDAADGVGGVGTLVYAGPAMRFDPEELDETCIHHLIVDSIVPRPIAWVSTVNEDGSRNLAPFSFFTGICPDPPLCLLAIAPREGADGRPEPKDTLRNAARTRELVIHAVPERALAAMNQSSFDYPYGEDELALLGLATLPAERIRGVRLAAAPIAMECAVERIVEVGDGPTSLVVCRILLWHVDDAILVAGRIDPNLLGAIGRMGTSTYARTAERVTLRRPRSGDWEPPPGAPQVAGGVREP